MGPRVKPEDDALRQAQDEGSPSPPSRGAIVPTLCRDGFTDAGPFDDLNTFTFGGAKFNQRALLAVSAAKRKTVDPLVAAAIGLDIDVAGTRAVIAGAIFDIGAVMVRLRLVNFAVTLVALACALKFKG